MAANLGVNLCACAYDRDFSFVLVDGFSISLQKITPARKSYGHLAKQFP